MKYEYKIVTIDTSAPFSRGGIVDEEDILEMIHDLAKKDWELVSTAPITRGIFFQQNGTTSKILFFFKRPKKSLTTKKLKE